MFKNLILGSVIHLGAGTVHESAGVTSTAPPPWNKNPDFILPTSLGLNYHGLFFQPVQYKLPPSSGRNYPRLVKVI